MSYILDDNVTVSNFRRLERERLATMEIPVK
jgi:hypothetical protein